MTVHVNEDLSRTQDTLQVNALIYKLVSLSILMNNMQLPNLNPIFKIVQNLKSPRGSEERLYSSEIINSHGRSSPMNPNISLNSESSLI